MYKGCGSQAGDEVDMAVAGRGAVPALMTGLVAFTTQLGQQGHGGPATPLVLTSMAPK
jgi:hypothetical protein